MYLSVSFSLNEKHHPPPSIQIPDLHFHFVLRVLPQWASSHEVGHCPWFLEGDSQKASLPRTPP